MSLDSSDTFTTATDGKMIPEEEYMSLSGKEELPDTKRESTSWVYMFTHRMKVDSVNRALKERFKTFVHKSLVYSRKENGVIKKEQQTISGLIFVCGNPTDVQDFLSAKFYGIHLVNDYSTGRTALIPEDEMDLFIRLSEANGREIRFMLHPLAHYQKGNALIRITSGELKGYTGYIVRLHRDRKLVTTIGNMTVAIGGVCKDSIANAEEYISEKKTLLQENAAKKQISLSHLQSEIDKSFFNPSNEIEAMAIVKGLDKWSCKSLNLYSSCAFAEAAEMCICLLDEIGSRFPAKYFRSETIGIASMCLRLEELLNKILMDIRTSDEVRERISVEMESLIFRHPALPLKIKETIS